MFINRNTILFVLFLFIVISFCTGAGKYWKMPPLPEPETYGNILINRFSESKGMKSVYFSHWTHRLKYTCDVCHQELEFSFQTNGTEITEEDNLDGLFCGACHDGKTAFAHTKENCDRCHTGSLKGNKEHFEKLTANLDRSTYGNKINWVKALEKSQIKPRRFLFEQPNKKPMEYSERLELKAEWPYVPPAYFPHKSHIQWLDCGNCHPSIFKIKKKSTKHFSMEKILEGKFCGVCHLRVAFPIDNCNGCHPAIKNN